MTDFHRPKTLIFQVMASRLVACAATIAALLVSSLPLQVSADDRQVVRARIADDTYMERFIPVGGMSEPVRAGVITGPFEMVAKPESLYVHLPAGDWKDLCVDIISRDGRYEAHLEYDVRKLPPGVYRLSFHTDDMQHIRNYRSRDLGVLAKLKASCEGPIQKIAVTSWDDIVSIDKLLILLKAERTRTKLLVPESPAILCKKTRTAEGIKSVAFDKECTLIIDENLKSVADQITIERKHFDDPLKPIPLPIALE